MYRVVKMKDGRKITAMSAGQIEFDEKTARRILKRAGSAFYLEEV